MDGGNTHVVTHPLLPVGPFVRLMIGAVSLGGTLGLGVTADQAAVPELDFLLHRIEQTAQDLIKRGGLIPPPVATSRACCSQGV